MIQFSMPIVPIRTSPRPWVQVPPLLGATGYLLVSTGDRLNPQLPHMMMLMMMLMRMTMLMTTLMTMLMMTMRLH